MLEGVASASLDVLQATALVAFVMCFVAMMVLLILTAMAAPMALAAKALARKRWDDVKQYLNEDTIGKPTNIGRDAFLWVFTWLALYGFYVYLTGGAA